MGSIDLLVDCLVNTIIFFLLRKTTQGDQITILWCFFLKKKGRKELEIFLAYSCLTKSK